MRARLPGYRGRQQASVTGKACALRLRSDSDRGGMRGLSASCGAFLARPGASPPSRAPFPSRRRRFSPRWAVRYLQRRPASLNSLQAWPVSAGSCVGRPHGSGEARSGPGHEGEAA